MEKLDFINQLQQAQQNFDLLDFTLIYGQDLGHHLWREFNNKHKGNLLSLWGCLTEDNQRNFVLYLVTR